MKGIILAGGTGSRFHPATLAVNKQLWRRVATRYDRCPTAFFSAVALAAIVIFWL